MRNGRKSEAEHDIAPNAVSRIAVAPDPPYELSEEQCEVWNATVNAQSADWFKASNFPLLVQYCKHVVASRRIAELIEKCTEDPAEFRLADYDKLLEMQRKETSAIVRLATSMRLAQHSYVKGDSPRTNDPGQTIQAPWKQKR